MYIYIYIYLYGLNSYFTDAKLGRDPRTPAGWTEKNDTFDHSVEVPSTAANRRKRTPIVYRVAVLRYSNIIETPFQLDTVDDATAMNPRGITFPKEFTASHIYNSHCRKPSV